MGEIELEVTVTNGQMTIGFYGYGEKGSDAWMDIDDVTLWKKGESSGLPKTVDVPNGGFEDNPNTVWVTTGDAFAVKLPDTNDPGPEMPGSTFGLIKHTGQMYIKPFPVWRTAFIF